MLRKYLCEARCRLRLRPVDPVLIKSGYASLGSVDMEPVRISRGTGGQPVAYFPGTSLKGVFRSHIERIARTLKPGSVCLPYYDPEKADKILVPEPGERKSYGCSYRISGQVSSAVAYDQSCAACRMFGSLKFTGRFSVSDAYPEPDKMPAYVKRDGVGIDRFTGGTVHAVLFNLEAVCGGEFTCDVRLVNFEPYQLAALYFLICDLRDQMLTIGMGASRGFGRVEAEVDWFKLNYARHVEELRCLGDLAASEDREAYGLQVWAPPEVPKLANGTQRGLRWEYDITERWEDLLSPYAPAFAAFLEEHPGLIGEPRGR